VELNKVEMKCFEYYPTRDFLCSLISAHVLLWPSVDVSLDGPELRDDFIIYTSQNETKTSHLVAVTSNQEHFMSIYS
jgi:hypothetical protein